MQRRNCQEALGSYECNFFPEPGPYEFMFTKVIVLKTNFL